MEGYCNGRPGNVGSVESEGEGEAGLELECSLSSREIQD